MALASRIPPRIAAAAAFAALAAAFGAVHLAARPGDTPPPAAPKPSVAAAAAFPKPEPAKNPVTLHLQADEKAVTGWVSGPAGHGGEKVTVALGNTTETVVLDENNTFQWKYKVEKPATAEFRFGDLRGSVALAPPPAKGGPNIFFVVDRTAYRPGQPLNFAGFVRTEDAAGEFVPVANTEIKVELVSRQKRTKATTLKLTSDERGRIVGSYVFADGDALDTYDLAAPGYKGGAHVLLGEYRKSKVKLKIGGEAKDGRMVLRFEPVDFLDKPVPSAGGSFTAQVVRKAGKEKAFTLKAEDFVNHEPRSAAFADLTSLSDDDLLFQEAEGVSGLTFGGYGNAVIHQLSGAVPAAGGAPAEYAFDLKPEWRKGDCEIVVSGVITDANGREQRATATVAIAGTADDMSKGVRAVELHAKKPRYFTTETIDVTVSGGGFDRRVLPAATLLVMKLAFQTPSATIPDVGRLWAMTSPRPRYRTPPVEAGTVEHVRRTLVTAVPFSGCGATLKLAEPGAYKLIVVVPDDQGGSTQKETTILVKRLDEVSALALALDKEEYAAGDRLTGLVQCRYADARALLTVRDSTGIRLVKPIAFENGRFALNEPMPAGLKYGFTVDVAYPEADDHVHIASAFARTVPADRMLKVDVATPTDVPPGSPVTLNLQVNRNEPVDLVVSVYDQSLLGIAADKAADVRNFYLADERADPRLAAAMLQRRIGAAKLGPLFAKAEAMVKAGERVPGKPLTDAERQSLQGMLNNRQQKYLYAGDLATVLRLAGVDVYIASYYGNAWYWYFPDRAKVESANDVMVRDLFPHDRDGWKIESRFVGDTLLLHETHASYAGNPYHARPWHPAYASYYGYPYYGGYNGLYLNNVTQVSGGTLMLGGAGRGGARGDGAWSVGGNGAFTATMNSSTSFAEGQAFFSHMAPAAGGPALIDSDGGSGSVMVRRDFSDSAFWNAGVRTNDAGKASVTFKLPDSLTNWQVVVTAVSPRMHVGGAKASFRTFKPVMVWPMLPRTFTEGDTVEVFASVHNRTDAPQTMKVKLKAENGEVRSAEEVTVDVPAKGNAPVYWRFAPRAAGFASLLMSAECAAGNDASLKRLPVVRSAAEEVVTLSGKVRDGATIELPEGFDPAHARLEMTFAPSLAADMADTLNYLVDYPYGCVEQTMSRFLPAIKVAQILKQFQVNNPPLEAKLPGCVAGGIKRLLELQQNDGGWGWNGSGQTHEMMTPYALFGLLQAEKAGYAIPNETAVERGLARLGAFIGQMGDGQAADRMYCLYVYGHRREFQPDWWQWIEKVASGDKVSDYALALALEMAVQKDKKSLADQLAGVLKNRAKKANGHAWWETAGFSRWGDDKFEVTAAAMKALVAWNADEPVIDNVLSFFIATKRGDRWNSTKDTAMILYAMTDFLAKSQVAAGGANTLGLTVNGGDRQTVTFDDQLTKKVSVPAEGLKPGKNTLAFDTKMTGVLYRAVFRYWKTGKAIPPAAKGIAVERKFTLLTDKGEKVKELKDGDSVPRGSYVLSEVTATNAVPVAMRYVLVENPKPASGETVPADDARFAAAAGNTPYVLREDREAMVCTHFEQAPQTLIARNVFLAELAGEFVVPPARVELMYQTEVRGHSGTFALKVVEKK